MKWSDPRPLLLLHGLQIVGWILFAVVLAMQSYARGYEAGARDVLGWFH
jgi:hypothetical protein